MNESADVYNGSNGEEAINFEGLFKSYYARLCYFAFGMVGDKTAAEDIAQDAFLKFYARRNDFSNESACKGFLYTTVRNACLNIIRHSNVKEKFLLTRQKDPVEDTQVLNSIIKAEVIGEIYKAIESLPEGCKTVFNMSFLDELKNQEIADKLDVSINTVKTQKARALQLLRLKLKNYYHFIFPLLLIKTIQ
jgi:RNA polymerase sigma-70 factor (ECF subfamily)